MDCPGHEIIGTSTTTPLLPDNRGRLICLQTHTSKRMVLVNCFQPPPTKHGVFVNNFF